MKKDSKDNKEKNLKNSIVVILDNIRSVQNVGAIFRTCDAAGVEKIYLVGYTPAPIDRFGKKRKDVAKASLGAEESVSWESFKNLARLIDKLKKDKYEIVALEQDRKSVNYKKFKAKKYTAIIVGNEVTGLTQSTLDKCDKIIEIPMKGKKESLNVSVALGVALFGIFVD